METDTDSEEPLVFYFFIVKQTEEPISSIFSYVLPSYALQQIRVTVY